MILRNGEAASQIGAWVLTMSISLWTQNDINQPKGSEASKEFTDSRFMLDH